ncbi:MAG: ABC transporter ATP-binding protein [Clostridium sp.]
MSKSNNKNISFFKIVRNIMPMAIKSSPLLFVTINIVGCIHGMSFAINTFMTQMFFDAATNMVTNNASINTVILIGVGLGLALIFSQLLNGVHNFMGDFQLKILYRDLYKKINEKSSKICPINFENPSFLDDISKADEGAMGALNIIIVLMSIFTIYIAYFIFMGLYLYKLKPILALSLIIIFIPIAITQTIKVKVFGDLSDESAPLRREYEYYERCIVDREYYKETRLLGSFHFFKGLYLKSMKLLDKKIWKAEKKSGLIELGMEIITLIGYMGVVYLLVYSLIKGDISVGAFAAVFSSIEVMFMLMQEVICSHIGSVAQSLGSVRNLIRFLEMEERGGKDIEIQGVPDISLENIEFIYPGAEKKSIINLNLKINKGETIAIVGENGAGKTTLVKLITGLYTPENGRVLIGGIDAASISTKSLYKGISGVFQKYQRYKMTLEENVSIGAMDEDYSIDNKSIEKKVEEAVEKADLILDNEKFPKGYDTMLSREFDGVDLSGGQWQRIAIARGFYRAHNMIVLDEPTAAIDPVEESRIYKKFHEMSKGNTSIIVTHRLGCAKIADRIVVMDNGNISEIGTHEELINNKGKYYDMYEAQSKWYVEEEVQLI